MGIIFLQFYESRWEFREQKKNILKIQSKRSTQLWSFRLRSCLMELKDLAVQTQKLEYRGRVIIYTTFLKTWKIRILMRGKSAKRFQSEKVSISKLID